MLSHSQLVLSGVLGQKRHLGFGPRLIWCHLLSWSREPVSADLGATWWPVAMQPSCCEQSLSYIMAITTEWWCEEKCGCKCWWHPLGLLWVNMHCQHLLGSPMAGCKAFLDAEGEGRSGAWWKNSNLQGRKHKWCPGTRASGDSLVESFIGTNNRQAKLVISKWCTPLYRNKLLTTW